MGLNKRDFAEKAPRGKTKTVSLQDAQKEVNRLSNMTLEERAAERKWDAKDCAAAGCRHYGRHVYYFDGGCII
jgi:hypothetical protein